MSIKLKLSTTGTTESIHEFVSWLKVLNMNNFFIGNLKDLISAQTFSVVDDFSKLKKNNVFKILM